MNVTGRVVDVREFLEGVKTKQVVSFCWCSSNVGKSGQNAFVTVKIQNAR